ncbi:MAG: type II secretion system major pseudopilin GspG [Candidatus Sumerlaeota bacterium]|nr:type II secretion system major pseudopilin GspG [Candidatus Sumerlaeota bacterium]
MRQLYSNRQARSRSAFTLIEIMVVVAILGILASVLVLKLKGRTDDAKVSVAKSDIATLVTALESFQMDMGRYPTTEEGLTALLQAPATDETDTSAGTWKGPYVSKMPTDPWGGAYVYECPGTVNTDGYDLKE